MLKIHDRISHMMSVGSFISKVLPLELVLVSEATRATQQLEDFLPHHSLTLILANFDF